MTMLRSLFASLLMLAAFAAHADFEGKVVRVLDGDTIDVLVDSRPVRVRLAEIDAPEKAQPYGTNAREALASLVAGLTVKVVDMGVDSRGQRTIGVVWAAGQNVNVEMVRVGMAWAYRHYLLSRAMLDVELAARESHLGLWADPGPVAPWEWRRSRRD